MREEGGRLSGVSGLLEERTPFELMSEIYTRRGSKPKIERDSGNMHAHLYRVQGVSRIQNQKWKYYLGLVAGRFPQGKTQREKRGRERTFQLSSSQKKNQQAGKARQDLRFLSFLGPLVPETPEGEQIRV